MESEISVVSVGSMEARAGSGPTAWSVDSADVLGFGRG